MAKDTTVRETPTPNTQDQKDALGGAGDQSAVLQQATVAGQDQGGDISTAPLSGTVIKAPNPNEREQMELPGLPDNSLTVVDEDIYEEFFLEGSDRPLYRLRHARGSVVRSADLKMLQASAPEAFLSRGGTVAMGGTGDVSQQVVGAESSSGALVEPQGPARSVGNRK